MHSEDKFRKLNLSDRLRFYSITIGTPKFIVQKIITINHKKTKKDSRTILLSTNDRAEAVAFFNQYFAENALENYK